MNSYEKNKDGHEENKKPKYWRREWAWPLKKNF